MIINQNYQLKTIRFHQPHIHCIKHKSKQNSVKLSQKQHRGRVKHQQDTNELQN